MGFTKTHKLYKYFLQYLWVLTICIGFGVTHICIAKRFLSFVSLTGFSHLYPLWVLATILYMFVVSTKCMTYRLWLIVQFMGFNLYDLWVSVVYVVGFCHIFGKKGKTFVYVMGFDQFFLQLLWVSNFCSTKRFQSFVQVMGFVVYLMGSVNLQY